MGRSFVLSLASMCRKEVRSAPCRHFWQTAFFMARNHCLAKSADIIVHCIFFCSWRSWPFVASKQLRNFEDVPLVSSENCWAWIVCRKFVACAKNWINSAKTKLPRKFVSRDRLCLRGIKDCWVNNAATQTEICFRTEFSIPNLRELYRLE